MLNQSGQTPCKDLEGLLNSNARLESVNKIFNQNGLVRRAIAFLLLAESLTNQVTGYKHAMDAYQAKLKDAYEGVKKQNDAITNLVPQ
jgi:hypothetical protein